MRVKKLIKLLATMPLAMFGICGIGAEGSEGQEGVTPENSEANNEDDQNPEGAETKDERTFTQAEVNKMMKAEKEKGRTSILKELGVKDFKTAKEGLEQYRQSLDANKTDLQKATEAAATAAEEKTAAERRAIFAESCLTAIQEGALSDYASDLVAIAITKTSDDVSLQDVLKEMKKSPAYSGFFTKPETQNQSGTGKLPSGKKPQTGAESYGAKLAKQHQKTMKH